MSAQNGQKGKGQPSRRRRRGAKAKPKPVDLWRPVPPLPEVEPIVPATDPTALLRSLGDPPPPMPGAAEIAMAQVIDRAAGLATALAAAGGLLAEESAADDEDAAAG
ncbi:MAG TPA: hypothetical protein VFP06_05700 [Acidimicrobiales bacterium]|nr:hypothetical protein [Acidimicrobiales bacterium]